MYVWSTGPLYFFSLPLKKMKESGLLATPLRQGRSCCYVHHQIAPINLQSLFRSPITFNYIIHCMIHTSFIPYIKCLATPHNTSKLQGLTHISSYPCSQFQFAIIETGNLKVLCSIQWNILETPSYRQLTVDGEVVPFLGLMAQWRSARTT